MGIYIFEVIFILVMPFFFRRIKGGTGMYCILTMLLLICVQGFRTENLGLYDVKNVYFPMFEKIQSLNFSQLIVTYPFTRGNFFQVATKIFTLVSENKYVWIFACSIPYIAAMKRGIKKYASNIYVCAFSFFLIMGLRIYASNFFLIRHSIAMAFLILAFDGIVEKDFKKFLVYTLIAIMFHTTAAVFLIAYPLARIRPSWKQILGIVVGFYAILYLALDLMNMIFGWMDSSNYYSAYETRNSGFDSLTFPIICGIMFAIAFILTRKNKNIILDYENAKAVNEMNSITVNMLCIGTIFIGGSTIVGEFYRLAYFFLTVSFVGLGNIISQERNQWLRWGLYIFLIAFLFIFMYRGLEPQGLVPYESWLF